MSEEVVDHVSADFLDVEPGLMQHEVGEHLKEINYRSLEVAGHSIVNSLPCSFDDAINFFRACGDGSFVPSTCDIHVALDVEEWGSCWFADVLGDDFDASFTVGDGFPLDSFGFAFGFG